MVGRKQDLEDMGIKALYDEQLPEGDPNRSDNYQAEIDESTANQRNFTIKFNTLTEDLQLLSDLLMTYDRDFKSSGKAADGLDFSTLSSQVKRFSTDLDRSIKNSLSLIKTGRPEGKDSYGNQIIFAANRPLYDEIEITHTLDYILFAVRMLDNRNNNRFVMIGQDMPPFNVGSTLNDPTVMNLVANLPEIISKISFSGLLPGDGPLSLSCQGRDVLKNIGRDTGLSSAEELGKQASSALTRQVTIEDMSWEEFTRIYIYPSVDIKVQPNPSINKDNMQDYLDNLPKVNSDPLQDFGVDLKLAISSTAEQGFQFANSSHSLLSSEAKDNLKNTLISFAEAYTEVIDRVSLGCLLESAAQCLLPALSCRDILRGMRASKIPARLRAAFPNQPRLVELINQEICKINLPDENIDEVLDAVEKFVDLEVLCDVSNFALGGPGNGFDLPEISMPRFNINSLFGSLRVSLDKAILEFLNESILQLVLGILDDLASCDDIDNLIAGVIDGEIPTDAGVAGDVANLFIKGDDFEPGESAVATSLGSRWQQFENRVEPFMDRLIKIEQSAELNSLGGAFQARQETDIRPLAAFFPRKTKKKQTNRERALSTVEQYAEVSLDTEKLFDFDGQGKEVFESAVRQFGEYTLSTDGSRFVFQRQSDDTLIVETVEPSDGTVPPGVVPGPFPGGEERTRFGENRFDEDKCDAGFASVDTVATSKQQMQVAQAVAKKEGVYDAMASRSGTKDAKLAVEEFGKLLDDVTTLFKPREVLSLIAGKAETDTCNRVSAFAKSKYPSLKFMKSSTKVCEMFSMLGMITGLDQLEDRILLAASAADIRRNVNIPCLPGEDPAENLLKDILTNTLPPEEVEKKLEEERVKKRDRYNDIVDTVAALQDPEISLEDALAPFACGLDADDNIPPLVDNTLDLALDAYLQPVQISFNEEIEFYSSAITEVKQIGIGPINKELTGSGVPDIEDASDSTVDIGQALLNVGSEIGREGLFGEEGDQGNDKRINPKWQSIAQSFPPGEPPPDKITEDTDVDGQKFNLTENQEVVGASLESGLEEYKNKFDGLTSNVFLAGSLGGITNFSSLLGSGPSSINIGIGPKDEVESLINTFAMIYGEEEGGKTLKIVTNGTSVPFYPVPNKESLSALFISAPNDEDTPTALLQDNFNGNTDRTEVFSEFMKRLTKNGFSNPADISIDSPMEGFYTDKFSKLTTGSVDVMVDKIIDNRLLKTPDSLSPKMAGSEEPSKKNAIVNIVDFAATPSSAQKACGDNPNLMKLDDLKFMMKKEYSRSSCEKRRPVNNGIGQRRGPIVSAAITGAVMGTIRLQMIEQVLRALFVYDELNYSEDLFVEDNLLMKYAIERMKADIKKQTTKRDDYYRKFLKESILVYNRRIKANDISLSGKPLVIIEPTSLGDSEFSQAKADETRDMREERYLDEMADSTLEKKSEIALMELSKEQMRSVLGAFASLLGKSQPVNQKRETIRETPVINARDNQQEGDRFASVDNLNAQSGKFLLEKYIRCVKDPSQITPLGAVEVNSRVNSLSDWESFVKKQLQENSDLNIPDNFNGLWRYGMRLIYIPYTEADPSVTFNLPEKIDKNRAEEQKAFYEERPDGSVITPIPVTSVEIPVTEFEKISDADGRIDELYSNKYENLLKDLIINDEDFSLIFDYCLSPKDNAALITIYTTLSMNSLEMDKLFVETKERLKALFVEIPEATNTLKKPDKRFETETPETLQNQQRGASIASPNKGLKLLQIILNTPPYILKGVAEMTDANVFTTSKIQAAGRAGYLIPKLQMKPGWNKERVVDEEGNITDECVIVPSAPNKPGKYATKQDAENDIPQIQEFEAKALGLIEPSPKDLRIASTPDPSDTPGDLFQINITSLGVDFLSKLTAASIVLTLEPIILGPIIASKILTDAEGSNNLLLLLQQLDSGYLGPGLPFASTVKVFDKTKESAEGLINAIASEVGFQPESGIQIPNPREEFANLILGGGNYKSVSLSDLGELLESVSGFFGLENPIPNPLDFIPPGPLQNIIGGQISTSAVTTIAKGLGIDIEKIPGGLPETIGFPSEIVITRDLVEYIFDFFDPSPSSLVFPGIPVDIPLNALTWYVPGLAPYNLYMGPGPWLGPIGIAFLLNEPRLYALPGDKQQARTRTIPDDINFDPRASEKISCAPENDNGQLSPGTDENCS